MYTWHSLLHTHDELLAASVHVARFESKTGKQDILMVVICCLTALPGIHSKVRKLNPIWTLNKMGPQTNSSPSMACQAYQNTQKAMADGRMAWIDGATLSEACRRASSAIGGC